MFLRAFKKYGMILADNGSNFYFQSEDNPAWNDDEIKRSITAGISRDGSKLKPPMGYEYYETMTADDLDAVVAYLRTVPAVD